MTFEQLKDVPRGLISNRFRLRPITADDAEADRHRQGIADLAHEA